MDEYLFITLAKLKADRLQLERKQRQAGADLEGLRLQPAETAGASRDLAAQGEILFRRFGCSGCHTPGSSVHAPSLIGLYGSPVPLSDGRVIIADDQYIHDSILLPNQDVAAGYRPIMPTFAAVLNAEEVMLLSAYIKSLGGAER